MKAWENDLGRRRFMSFESQVVRLLKDPDLEAMGIKLTHEMQSGLQPFDLVLSWRHNGVSRSTVVEIDGSIHFYSLYEPIINQATDFKVRVCDLYNVP